MPANNHTFRWQRGNCTIAGDDVDCDEALWGEDNFDAFGNATKERLSGGGSAAPAIRPPRMPNQCTCSRPGMHCHRTHNSLGTTLYTALDSA